MSDTLSCRYVRQSRVSRKCSECGRTVRADVFRFYGGKEVWGKPITLWYCLPCMANGAWSAVDAKVAALRDRLAKIGVKI